MSQKWHFYSLATGLFSPRAFFGPARALEANTPDGYAAHSGQVDCNSQRMDLDTFTVVDYQPPQPSPNHVWRARRWVLSDEASELISRVGIARARIRDLEARQARAVREATLGHDGASDRLKAIDDEIAQLRQVING